MVHSPRVKKICWAAALLDDSCTHGCVLADEVGFGKTKQALLVALPCTMLFKERLSPKHSPVYREPSSDEKAVVTGSGSKDDSDSESNETRYTDNTLP